MILTYTCTACGWPRLAKDQRSDSGAPSFEICSCCGFQPGFTDDSEGVTAEGWRQRWTDSLMVFNHPRDGLPPADWDPSVQLEALLTHQPPEVPDLPDSSMLRGALEAGNLPLVLPLLNTSTVVVALAGPTTDDDAVVLALTKHYSRLLVFTGPEQWQAWASTPGRPRQAAAISGSGVVPLAEAHGADSVLIDLNSPSFLFVTVAQLRALSTMAPPPFWREKA